MQLTKTEVLQLKELLLSCTNTITSMSFFLSQVQDTDLKEILTRQYPFHVQDYDRKAEFLKEIDGPKDPLRVPEQLEITWDLSKEVQVTPTAPDQNTISFSDREIATNYLLTLKRAGKEYACAALEASHPKLRQFLKDAFTLSCNHAYEVWDWMVRHKYYAHCPELTSEIEKAAAVYNLI